MNVIIKTEQTYKIMINNLTEEQVLAIPSLIDQRMTCKQIAEQYQVHERTINKWIGRLRADGIVVNTKKGRPKMKLKQNEINTQ